MAAFYTNVTTARNDILVRGYEDGKQFSHRIPYKPYLFAPDNKNSGRFKTLEGKAVGRVDFDSMGEARGFLKEYDGVHGAEIYGLSNFQYVYIHDSYDPEIKYDPAIISVVGLDIEVSITDGLGFPDVQLANNPVTLITLSRKGNMVVFGCGEYVAHQPNVKYYKCADERALLKNFLSVWNTAEFGPDVVTGWNIEFFDIPYLVNRISKVLGEQYAKKLSPWGIITESSVNIMNKENQVFAMSGISTLDYLQVYKKFAYKNQESYTLDHIAHEELGERKLDYGKYGSLAELERQDFQMYAEYNVRDVELVDKLEKKLKLIELIFAMAYDAKVNYQDTFTTVRLWDIMIHNYLMDRNVVIHQLQRSKFDRQIMGGYVKEPQVGMHEWVVSLDLNSLYPHIIMQYNISPEMFRGKFPHPFSIDDSLNGFLLKHEQYLKGNQYTVTANMCQFYTGKQGFLPAIMEKIYNDRVVYKKQMLSAEQELVHCTEGTPEHEHWTSEVARLDSLQQSKKIQLNSGYGALANVWNRWYDVDFAEAITSSGQLTTRWIEIRLNAYLNKILGTEGIDYVIACDTDSVYLRMDGLVNKLFADQSDKQKIVKFLDDVCKEKFEPFINKQYEDLAGYVNAREQKMRMKRECIADRGIWTGAKHYILNVYNKEGVAYETPKLKMMGIEAIRTSTPYVVRTAIKKSLEIIMNGTELQLQTYVSDFRDEFSKMSFTEVAFPRSVNDLEKWTDYSTLVKKGTPVGVGGALIYNHLIKERGIAKKYESIPSGSKVKWSYMIMPNPARWHVISCPGPLPPELNLDKFIDYDAQFFKAFLKPMSKITGAVGWDTERKANLLALFT